MISFQAIVSRGSISSLTKEKEKEDSVSQGSVMRKIRTMMPVTVAEGEGKGQNERGRIERARLSPLTPFRTHAS